jgi:hypothetical protein
VMAPDAAKSKPAESVTVPATPPPAAPKKG